MIGSLEEIRVNRLKEWIPTPGEEGGALFSSLGKSNENDGKPLYATLRGTHTLVRIETEQEDFDTLKKALVSALTLALSDVSKQSHLFVDEAWGITKF